MKRFLLQAAACSIALGLGSGPVLSADMSTAPSYDWTGFYAGVTAGYGWGDYQQDDNGGGGTQSFDMDGFVGGGTLGYNSQLESVVLGIETDFSISDINGSNDSYPGWICNGVNACSNDVDWFGTVRARIGLPMDQFLPYITGGLAIAEVDSGDSPVDGGVFTRFDKVQLGWTIGGGLEAAVTENLSVKAEVLYVDLGDVKAGNAVGFHVENDFTVARVGVNWNF